MLLGDVFTELNRFLRMATRAKPSAFARERQEVLVLALGVGAANPGKSFVQIATSQVFYDPIIHHRPKEAVAFVAMLIMAGLEILVVLAQDLPQGGSGGLSWVVNWPMGRHEKPLSSLNRGAKQLVIGARDALCARAQVVNEWGENGDEAT